MYICVNFTSDNIIIFIIIIIIIIIIIKIWHSTTRLAQSVELLDCESGDPGSVLGTVQLKTDNNVVITYQPISNEQNGSCRLVQTSTSALYQNCTRFMT